MTVTLTETFRAVFYAPFYAAHALDAYGDEGIDVRLNTPSSPAETESALMSGETDVSWGGPMRLLVGRDREPACSLVGFCEVVTRDPFFVIGHTPRPDFRMSDLAGIRLGTVSEVPTPWMCLQDDIRRAGLDPSALNRVSDRSMADNAKALRTGALDTVQLFQPFVERLVQDGAAHIWYAAAMRGATSYTTLFTTRRNLSEKRDVMLAMTRAVHRTQKWVHANDAATIAATVAPFFPDLDADTLTACIARYKGLGIWGRDPMPSETGFERLRGACLSGGLIERGAAYAECIDTSLARDVIEADPPSM